MLERVDGKARSDQTKLDRAFRIEGRRLERILMLDGALGLPAPIFAENGSGGGRVATEEPTLPSPDR
jgi:hypothetical protein